MNQFPDPPQKKVDQATVASDGFMLNINAVLNKLCEPFMDASFSKVCSFW